MQIDKYTLADVERAVENSFTASQNIREAELGNVESISTGSLSLDMALGIGGFPRGRISEIFGPEASGKSTLALHVIAEVQKQSGLALFIDARNALDVEYASKLGIDVDKLLIAQPSTGEEALEIMDMMVRTGAIDVVVLDSVEALVFNVELQGESDFAFLREARVMSQALRKLGSNLKKSNTTAIFVKQERNQFGMTAMNQEYSPRGRALKFFADVRVEMRGGHALFRGNDQIGARTKVKVVKNKVGKWFRSAEFDIIFGRGISIVGDVLDVAVTQKLVDCVETYYNYGDVQMGQGRDNAIAFLEENIHVAKELDHKLRLRLLGRNEPDLAEQGERVESGAFLETDQRSDADPQSHGIGLRQRQPEIGAIPTTRLGSEITGSKPQSPSLDVKEGELEKAVEENASLLEEVFGVPALFQSSELVRGITTVIGMKLDSKDGIVIWIDNLNDTILAAELKSTYVDVTFALSKDTSAYSKERENAKRTEYDGWLVYVWKEKDGSVCTLRDHQSNTLLVGHWRIRSKVEQTLTAYLLPIANEWHQSKSRLKETVRGILSNAKV